MPDYAKLGREAFERQAEITCEEFRIYSIIVFHSYVQEDGVRICKKTLDELCEIYPFLDYDNTSRRLKRLRTGNFSKNEKPKKTAEMKSPWIKKSGKFFQPLVGVKTVKITDFEEEKTVKITDKNCKNYSKKDKKTVKNTVSLSFKDKFLNKPEKSHTNGVCVEEKKSQFSFEEIQKYVALCVSRGDRIYSPIGLATKLLETREADSLISATLYPETFENADEKLQSGLALLMDVRADGLEVKDFEKFYSQEEWQWLMNKLKESE